VRATASNGVEESGVFQGANPVQREKEDGRLRGARIAHRWKRKPVEQVGVVHGRVLELGWRLPPSALVHLVADGGKIFLLKKLF
jgi:hypothetical protein